MNRYPRYPAYKPSGVEWLGEIPEHWDLRRLKFVSECLDGKRIPLNAEQRGEMQGNFPYWGANGVVDYINDWIFDEDLVLLGEDGSPFFDPHKPVAFFVTGRVWVNNHIHVLRPYNINPEFLVHSLNIVDYQNYIEGTTRDKLTQGKMMTISVLYPPIEEQQAIVAFLDEQTAVLDSLITEKRALIDLLQEKRTAVISTAVTQGLDTAVAMKESGVDWIGRIPAHWEIFPLRRLHCLVQTGPFGSQLHASDYIENGYPVVNPAHISDGKINPDMTITVDEETRKQLSRHVFYEGDIVLGRRGELGRSALVTEQESGWLCGTGSLLIRLFEDSYQPAYLAEYLRLPMIREYFSIESVGSTMDNLNTKMLLSLPILAPPKEEQLQILRRCSQETTRLDELIAETEASIATLQEYRTALIAAAVTGQIDVRSML